MTKRLIQSVFDKYDGLCAYTGKPLGDDWQVDHIIPKCHYIWFQSSEMKIKHGVSNVDDIKNLMPAKSIVNHYKRALDLDGFRYYMCGFHKRIAKLPKKTKIARTQKRKDYMMKLAELFDITTERPFNGKFYFETL